MSYLLDTNACICYLNGRSAALRKRLTRSNDRDLVVCSVVKAELFYGAERSNRPSETRARQLRFLNRFISIPFDDLAAEEYGRIRADLECKGAPIGGNDLLIASIALAHDLTLVTHNTAEFGRVPELHVEDWELE